MPLIIKTINSVKCRDSARANLAGLRRSRSGIPTVRADSARHQPRLCSTSRSSGSSLNFILWPSTWMSGLPRDHFGRCWCRFGSWFRLKQEESGIPHGRDHLWPGRSGCHHGGGTTSPTTIPDRRLVLLALVSSRVSSLNLALPRHLRLAPISGTATGLPAGQRNRGRAAGLSRLPRSGGQDPQPMGFPWSRLRFEG